eukprot:5944304-Amphidinium_carterae.1
MCQLLEFCWSFHLLVVVGTLEFGTTLGSSKQNEYQPNAHYIDRSNLHKSTLLLWAERDWGDQSADDPNLMKPPTP